ncbi:uncharacterized protein B0T15DRAFT_231473 [Chaetomium strumarium]|uniref:2EXR domain-containing protein n=1 Tax=Chaetomium strumarium TaxID=1170767 RepID=A0AAJ0GQ70_9PEZI|nr:hypothetical protein B0T15DRAFT_231473 [Chaetomium strumarium]
MSSPSSSSQVGFPRFLDLPAELRFQIWEAAFAAPAVLAAVHVGGPTAADADAVDDIDAEAPAYAMSFVGPAPYLVGLACREAMALLRRPNRSGVQQIFGPAGVVMGTSSPWSRRPHWVNLDTTVVHLRTSADASEVLGGFDADVLPRFRHVAWIWQDSDPPYGGGLTRLVKLCRFLALVCSTLETITIQWDWDADEPCPLTREVAAFCAAIPACRECPCNGCGLAEEMPLFRQRLLEHFTNTPPPRLHLLPPGFYHPLP